MAWIRLSDNYDEDPKIEALTDGAFRLWHQVLAFCRRHQTDGLIQKTKMVSFQAYRPKRLDELMASGPVEAPWTPLVSKVEGFGFKLNAYLKWNPSKDEENERRADSRDRMRLSRERRVAVGVAPQHIPPVARNETCNEQQTTRAQLPVRRGTDLGLSDSDDGILERAGRLREHSYPAWFREFRGGALPLVASPKELHAAAELCKCFSDERLQQIAEVVLTTNDPWISQTDRGFWVFVKKASWADDRLRQVERSA